MDGEICRHRMPGEWTERNGRRGMDGETADRIRLEWTERNGRRGMDGEGERRGRTNYIEKEKYGTRRMEVADGKGMVWDWHISCHANYTI